MKIRGLMWAGVMVMASCGPDVAPPVVEKVDPQVMAAIEAYRPDELKRLLERENKRPSLDVIRAVAGKLEATGARGEAGRRMLAVLLERSADPGACWRDGGTRCLITVATGVKDREAVKLLFQYGYQPRSEEGCDAFLGAVEEGDLAMVDLYLGAKVDVNCRGDEAYGGERSPLSVAVEFRRREVIAKLEAAGAREW